MTSTQTKTPSWAQPDILIFPSFLHTELGVETVIKTAVQPPLKLDSDSQICLDWLSSSPNPSSRSCPRGASCPQRHILAPSPLNYNPSSKKTGGSLQSRTVCKHWLRGLCKKAGDCEFLHEYNLRRMPECWFFTKHGFCSSGDECMYLHVTPFQRRGECKSYNAGFCRKGPDCPLKHLRKVVCEAYLTGFCPNGLECQQAHPPFLPADLDRLASLSQRSNVDVYRNRDRDWPYEAHPNYSGNAGSGQYLTNGSTHISPDTDMLPGGMRRPPGKILRGVTCFKCGIEGHLANTCVNPSRPGNRGGIERGPGGRPLNG